ncbi:hypothetical protein J6590_027606 [Homalodisca vitripennis]|nr:hypothetical protein J6590_027606 [Homalodisca vitripennis]
MNANYLQPTNSMSSQQTPCLANKLHVVYNKLHVLPTRKYRDQTSPRVNFAARSTETACVIKVLSQAGDYANGASSDDVTPVATIVARVGDKARIIVKTQGSAWSETKVAPSR